MTVPLSRYGLIGSWLLMFLIFERRVAPAPRGGTITRHVTVPLSRYGLIGSWLLMFLIFER
ncbi:ABC transporter permease, partial [Klebsiella pneumoniae]